MFLYEAAPRKIHAILAKRAKFDLGSRSLKDLKNSRAQVELHLFFTYFIFLISNALRRPMVLAYRT